MGPLYADGMAGSEFRSLEELIRMHHIVHAPIAAWDLETGMVLRFDGKLRIVISVSYETTESGPVVVVETVGGMKRFPSNEQLGVWHSDGIPFLVEPPSEYSGIKLVRTRGGGSVPPAHDAAGIVPLWRGPKRSN
jgi:hypothetical protein